MANPPRRSPASAPDHIRETNRCRHCSAPVRGLLAGAGANSQYQPSHRTRAELANALPAAAGRIPTTCRLLHAQDAGTTHNLRRVHAISNVSPALARAGASTASRVKALENRATELAGGGLDAPGRRSVLVAQRSPAFPARGCVAKSG